MPLKQKLRENIMKEDYKNFSTLLNLNLLIKTLNLDAINLQKNQKIIQIGH